MGFFSKGSFFLFVKRINQLINQPTNQQRYIFIPLLKKAHGECREKTNEL